MSVITKNKQTQGALCDARKWPKRDLKNSSKKQPQGLIRKILDVLFSEAAFDYKNTSHQKRRKRTARKKNLSNSPLSPLSLKGLLTGPPACGKVKNKTPEGVIGGD